MQVDLLESEFEVEGVHLIALGHLLGKMFFIIGYVECIQGFILRELQHHLNVGHVVALSVIGIDLCRMKYRMLNSVIGLALHSDVK